MTDVLNPTDPGLQAAGVDHRKRDGTKSPSFESSARDEMRQWWSKLNRGRWLIERELFRNLLYYLGYQWIFYSAEYRQWRRAELRSWVPKPVTNRFAPTIDLIRSAIINADPKFLIDPARMDDKVIASARIANDFLSVLQADSMFRKAKRDLAGWLVMGGTALLASEFSSSPEYGVTSMPGEKCTNCGLQLKPSELPQEPRCPECGAINSFLEDITVQEDLPRGRLVSSAWGPFETFVDQGTEDLDDQPAIILARSYHVETVRRNWPDSIDTIEPETSAPIANTYLNTMALPSAGYFGGGILDRVLVRRLYIQPCDKYPDGIYAVMTGGGRLIECKTYPFVFEQSGRPYYPMAKAVYGQVPGRWWGKTPANDLAYKQGQRNRFESLFELITMTMASPVWVIPTGANPSKITGAPGIQITATPVGGVLPTRLQGMGPDASLVQFITKIDDDFEEIASTFSVMKGKNPGGGVRAASALRQLEDRGWGAFGAVFENLEETYVSWAVISLEQFRCNSDSPMTRIVMNSYGAWATEQFKNTDLTPELNIRVEANSVRPKSNASKMDTIQRLVAMGVVNPAYPEQKMRVLEEAGMLSLLPGVDLDKEHAMKENAVFLQAAKQLTIQLMTADPQAQQQMIQQFIQNPPVQVNLLIDEHIAHFVYHRRFSMTDEYQALHPALRAWWESSQLAGHLDAYQALMARGGAPGTLSPVPFGAAPPPQPGGQTPPGSGQKQAQGGLVGGGLDQKPLRPTPPPDTTPTQ
jgi:hypothetical protein